MRATGDAAVDERSANASDQLWFVTFEVDRSALQPFRESARRMGGAIERAGLAIFASGTALRLELPGGLAGAEDVAAAATRLAGARRLDPASGLEVPVSSGDRDDDAPARALPLALSALPFDREVVAALVVPQVVVIERDEVASIVLVGTDRAAVLRRAAAWPSEIPAAMSVMPGGPPPDSYRLGSARPHEEFCDLVGEAVADIRRGLLEKVVLVREVLAEGNRPFDIGTMTATLRGLYPTCTVFAIGGFVGASPELLVSRYHHAVTSHPLAGTVGRSGDVDTDSRLEAELLGSPKERSEHAAVVDAVASALGPLCEQLEVPDAPSVVELRNVSHLGTLVRGRLRGAGAEPPSVLELVALLHPTPAVAGTPRREAVEWIAKHEGFDRGPYTGAVGWIDAAGDGEWYVGIRAALVEGSKARLFAGVGVVADSDPRAELIETQLKLQALLAAAIRP